MEKYKLQQRFSPVEMRTHAREESADQTILGKLVVPKKIGSPVTLSHSSTGFNWPDFVYRQSCDFKYSDWTD